MTGRPGAGKTTVIRRIAAALGGAAGGFTTEEVRERGRRVGFRIEDLSGRGGILSHVEYPRPPSVGRYGVDLGAMEEFGIRALEDAIRHRRVLIVDEIGKMELLHPRFKPVVVKALESGLPLVATVLQAREPFVDRIKAATRPTEVTRSNRDGLPERILADLEAWRRTQAPRG